LPPRVEWNSEASVTPLGHFAFFVEYLKASGRFDALVADCPLAYTSGNAPAVRDVVGTALLGILAGHWRYAHLTALRGDSVSPALLGMRRVMSEDAVRRGFAKIDLAAGEAWLQRHLKATVEPLLSEPWLRGVFIPSRARGVDTPDVQSRHSHRRALARNGMPSLSTREQSLRTNGKAGFS
jgi:hypothetical protein